MTEVRQAPSAQNKAVAPGPDNFEGGLVPVAPEESPETIAAREAATQAQISQPVTSVQTEETLNKIAAASGVTIEDLKGMLSGATAAHEAEIQALRQELSLVKSQGNQVGADGLMQSVGGFPWMYWKKPPTWPDKSSRNWVFHGPGGQSPVSGKRDTGSYAILLKKGMIPLPSKYGIADVPNSEWGVIALLPLFQRGGAVEFPASQVIAYNWHINPPITGLTFPQYEAIKDTVKNFICEACGKTVYFLPEDMEAGNFYRSHLMQQHKYPFREAAEAVRSQGFSLTPFRPASIDEITAPGAKPH